MFIGKSITAQSGEKKGATKMQNIITHPRFLGKDDHVVYELIQKPRNPPPVNEKTYKCNKCGFSTTRIEVIIYHSKSHSRVPSSMTSANKKVKKQKSPRRELKLPRAKTSTIDEDLELLQKGYSIGISSSNDDDESPPESPKVQRKKKMTKRKNTKPKPKSNPEEKKDVRTDILAEWQEDSDEDSIKNNVDNDSIVEKVVEPVPSNASEKEEDSNQTKSQSENTENILSGTDTNKNDINKEVSETVTSKITDDSSSGIEVDLGAKEAKKEETTASKDDDDFKAVLESTTVAPIPDISDLSKMNVNKNIDKKTVKASEKTDTHPKKRFVKYFEDFEQLMKMKNENKPKESKTEEEPLKRIKGIRPL